MPEWMLEFVHVTWDWVYSGDDGVGAPSHSCAPVVVCAAAAVGFLVCSSALAGYLLGSVSCGTAGWLPPFCVLAEQ